MQKDVQITMCFQNRAKVPLRRRGGIERTEATKENVKMGKMGKIGKI